MNTLFDLPPRDPAVPAASVPRLSRQSRAILQRLREGPATNAELAGIALKYTSRISDCRLAGAVIVVDSHDHRTGLAVYRLDKDVEGVA